jgi:2-oxo-3-hexenedioate decarboxylase
MTGEIHSTMLDGYSAADLEAIARTMRAAQDAAQQLQPITSNLPAFNVASAYAVAQLLHETRLREGARPVGRKLGFTNPDMWERYGVREPIWAYLYENTVRAVDDHHVCRLGRLAEPKIEPEIVVHFGSTPAIESDVHSILKCIDWVAHGFEVVQSHFPGWTFCAPDCIVDSALHGMLLIGKPQLLDRFDSNLIGALEEFEISLYCNDELKESGRGSNVLGSPLAAVVHLIRVLANQLPSTPLLAGEIVTTGTITAAQSIRAGQTWHTKVRGIALPGLSVRFEA